ncbi:CLUMA_CG013780, isoform A [Clunio marinus]|uniref:CLUMA_CG013780, isoform A n=1 Tax=Clunio marinus TaxID=568069 RepID=A0A1J1IJV5_9DIPT|nr:CLUMA_CG013780, isoform A [Clunio marinus]
MFLHRQRKKVGKRTLDNSPKKQTKQEMRKRIDMKNAFQAHSFVNESLEKCGEVSTLCHVVSFEIRCYFPFGEV